MNDWHLRLPGIQNAERQEGYRALVVVREVGAKSGPFGGFTEEAQGKAIPGTYRDRWRAGEFTPFNCMISVN